MTSQTSKVTSWRRVATGAIASGALAVGMLSGASFASAAPDDTSDPSSPVSPGPASASSPISPGLAAAASGAQAGRASDETLLELADLYDTGAGGGQISNLIHRILKLRAAGFAPSKGNAEAVRAAFDKRPNQKPMIEALEATLSYQLRNQQRQAMVPAQQNPLTVGVNPTDPNGNQSGMYIGPSGQPAGPGTVNIPLG